MATLGCLITSAIAAYAADVVISAVPYTITAPGNYVLASNLTCTVNQPAITINVTLPGKVVLDLRGFTISGFGTIGSTQTASGVYLYNPTNSYISIKNGIIQGFYCGVCAYTCNNIHVDHLTFTGTGNTNALFEYVNGSSISDCTFAGTAGAGILDISSTTGNSYSNNLFRGSQYFLLNVDGNISKTSSLILEHCQFGVPKK